MNCDCKSDLEQKLTERHAAAYPDAKNHKATLDGYGFGIVGNTMITQGFVKFTATAEHPVNKTGGYKEKKIPGSMIWSFCPFCGKPAKEGGAA